jgi:hypothetical protein
MLECLVINSCGNIDFVHSIVKSIFHNSNYDINITYHGYDKFPRSCDIILFFPKHEIITKKIRIPIPEIMQKIMVDELIGNYGNVNFRYYAAILAVRYTDDLYNRESSIICTNNYNMNDSEFFASDGALDIIKEDGTIFLDNFRQRIRTCILRRINNILADKYLESGRDKHASIRHSIEFSPQHYQAGLGILNYFGTVIRHRYPDIPVRVRIEQEGLTVRMIIYAPEGHRETVEHTLEAYALVVTGKMLPEELLSDPYHVLELKHKLELTQTELRLTHNLLQIAERQNQDQQHRLLSLETEMANLRQLIGDSFHMTRGAQQHAQELTSMLQLLLTTLTTQHDRAVQQALVTLKGAIERGITTQDEQMVKEALVTLQHKEPGVFRQMADLLGKGAITGTAGRLLYDWLMHLNVIFR